MAFSGQISGVARQSLNTKIQTIQMTRCLTDMTPIAKTQHLIFDFTDTDFKETIIKSGDAFIIQVRADWCGECFIMSSIVEQLADAFSDRITFGVINVDMNEHVTKHYGVTELPFLLFFNHGELVDFLIGLQSRKKVQQVIEKTIGFAKK
jgi:thioredoxin 1